MMLLALTVTTLPDIETGKKRFQLEGLMDNDAAKALFHLHKQANGHRRLANTLQRIVLITGILKQDDQLEVVYFGGVLDSTLNAEEREFRILDELHQFMQHHKVKLIVEQSAKTIALINTRTMAWIAKQMSHSQANLDILPPVVDWSQHVQRNLADDLGDANLKDLAIMMGIEISADMSLTECWDIWQQQQYDVLNKASLQKTVVLYQLGSLLEYQQGFCSAQQLKTILTELKQLVGS